jgi:ADP-ribosylglycohydrolase
MVFQTPEERHSMAKDLFDVVYGCMIGGAIGDALGAPVEGWNYWEIREEYGRLEKLTASPRENSNQQPGGVTGDTVLRQYIALAIVRKEGRILPDDLAELWLEKGSYGLLWSNERTIYEKLAWGMDPWDTGRGANLCGTATMAIAPVGLVNAANPAQAYQDGYVIASVNQDGEERSAAAALAAGIAAALYPEATRDDVLSTMQQHSSQLMQRSLELTMDLSSQCTSVDEFTERFYAHLADWRMACPRHRIKEVPEGYPKRAKYHSGSSLELIPVALALLHLCQGDVNEAIIAGANFGRDCDTIAGIIGCIAGALEGATAIRGEWVDACEAANRDLFEFLEDDPSANFYSMAWRLVKVLQAERRVTRARLKVLDRVLRW